MTLIQFLGEWVVRSSLLILAGVLLLWLLHVKNPSVRLTAWTAMLAGSLMIPVLSRTLPNLPLFIGRRLVRAPAAAPAAAIREPAAILLWAVKPDLTSAPTTPRPLSAKPFDWTSLAAILYVVAAGALLLRIAVGLVIGLRLCRQSRSTEFATGGFDVRESDRVASPVTIGVLRPAVLLPSDWREWDSAKLDAVLAHERSHVRRHDPAVQFVSAIHRALLWASPLSWFLDRSIVRTAEQISDDAAVAMTRDRVSYAQILLEFVQRGAARTNWLGVPMARYDRPEKRIRRVLNSTAIPREVTRWSIAGILALGTPLAYLAAAAHPQSASQAAPLAAPISLAPSPPPAIPAATGQVAVPAPTSAPGPPAVQTAASQPPTAAEPAPEFVTTQDQPAAAALPAFEVASIKPADRSTARNCCITIYPGARVDIHALPLKTLVAAAFRLSFFQVSGGDAWTGQDEYDIEAKPPSPSLFVRRRLLLRLQTDHPTMDQLEPLDTPGDDGSSPIPRCRN
jgi:beta-lactamase regulating signal transducer with metallopeptidase domain